MVMILRHTRGSMVDRMLKVLGLYESKLQDGVKIIEKLETT